MALIRFNLRETRGGELSGHGVQHSDTVLHAAVRDHEHRLLQMENEQGPRLHDVHPLLRLRRRLADVRVRDTSLPGVGQRSRGSRSIKTPPGRRIRLRKRTHTYGSRHHHRHCHWRVSADERNSSPRSPLRAEEETVPVIIFRARVWRGFDKMAIATLSHRHSIAITDHRVTQQLCVTRLVVLF